MLEFCKVMLDKGGYICAMFMDLSKVFDIIKYHLMVAKLKIYGFSQDGFQYMRNYVTSRQQRV